MSRASLLAALLAAPAASAPLPQVSLAIQESDSDGTADRLRGLVEELGGSEALRELGHGVKPIRYTVLLLPAARYAEFARQVQRKWPRVVIEREALVAVDAAAARERKLAVAALEELGNFESQLPVLSGFLQLRLEKKGDVEPDWLRVVSAVVEDRLEPHDLLIQAKASNLRHSEVRAPASGSATSLSADSVAAAKELRVLFDGGRPRSAHILAQRLRALEDEAKDFRGFLKERPALSAVLADARRSLRERLKPPASKAP